MPVGGRHGNRERSCGPIGPAVTFAKVELECGAALPVSSIPPRGQRNYLLAAGFAV